MRKRKYSDSHTFFALYESNLLMRRRQAETLLGRSVRNTSTVSYRNTSCFILFSQFNPSNGNDYRMKDGNYSVIWFDDFKQLLPYDTYFIANEFFNVYPIHKFQVKLIS